MGTNAGLYRLRAADGTLERTLLHGACFTSMTTDHEGNLWATTLDNGVYLLINPEVDLMNRHTALGFDNCLYINNLSADRLAIGSDGFQCAFVEGQQVRSLQLPVHLGLGKVRAMRQRDNGDLYAMTGITTVRLSPQLAVKQVLLIGLRDLWFAGEQVYITKPNGLAELPLEDFHTSREIEKLAGEKQVAEDGGICFRTGTDGTLYQVGNAGVHFRTAQGWKRLLLPESMQRNISDLCQLPSGDLWIASRVSGLCCLRNGRCFSLGTGEGLPSDFVTCLMSDPSGALWAGTANGLACIRTQMKQGAPAWDIRTFSTGNGLVSNAINDLAFFQGRVWAATEKGVCIFREDQLSRPPVPPRLVLPTVSFHDRRAVARDGIYETPYPRNNLMLTYTAIAPGSAGAITYQYRLAGQDEGWSTTTSTQLQYPSLAPGEYTFEIRALNRDKVPSALQTVRLRILPAFWQTWWFRLSGLLLLLALAGGLVYLRVRALWQTHRLREYLMQLENDKLTSAFDEVTLQRKMLELEQKALLLHMNPHFVFNSINAIHGFYASGEPDLGRKYISRFSQLLRTILDFSSQKRISLRQETDMLDLYLSLNQLRFDDKFEYALETDPALDQEAIPIPPMLIQPFVENALLHGIAPLKRKGQIWIRLWREQACLVCEVEDNGIGRVRARALQEGRIHTSTGIKVTEERIRLHNGLPPGLVVKSRTCTGRSNSRAAPWCASGFCWKKNTLTTQPSLIEPLKNVIMSLKTLLIDDEKQSRNALRADIARYCPELTIVGEGDSVESGLELMDEHEPDLVFLDINLGDGLGFEVLERAAWKRAEVIFVTAYDQYAIRAFRFSAIDFLLKPADSDDLVTAVGKVLKKTGIQVPQLTVLKESMQARTAGKKLVLREQDVIHVVRVSTIIYCQAMNIYTRFFLEDGQEIIISKNLKEYEQLLEPHDFLRVHHSYLINMNHILRFDKTEDTAVLTGGHQVPVSQRKREAMLAWLKTL